MKKKQIAILMAALLTATCLFTACGNAKDDPAGDDRTERIGTDSAADGETIVENTSEDPSASDVSYYEKSVYGTLLNDYYTLITATLSSVEDPNAETAMADDNLLGETGVQEFIYSYPDDAFDRLGYLVRDFSGDGIPELVIGYVGEGTENQDSDSMIFALYTCVDDQPYGVLDGWYRNKYYSISSNRFGYYGSGGAASSAFGAFALSEDGTEMIWEDYYFSDCDPNDFDTILYFHNTTGDWDHETSEQMDVEAEEFWDYEKKYTSDIVTLPLVPFCDFIPATGENADDAGYPVHVESSAALEDYQEHGEFTDGASPQTQFMLIADETVYDVEIFSITNLVYEDNGADYESQVIYQADQLDPERPLLLKLTFLGDTPSYGLSYRTVDGIYQTFFVEQSGRDGSVILTSVSAG